MKLILSRKGFDSAAGGGPSPVLPDGTALSLPIPADDARRYRDVRAPDGRSLGSLLARLGRSAALQRGHCHLDPDLDPRAVARRPGWRPTFGTAGAAATHLRNEGVGQGDLFVFFGWFRHVEGRANGTRNSSGIGPARRLAYRAGSDMHLVFGYLQVGEIFRPSRREELPPWLRDHPHAGDRLLADPANCLYVASDRLSLDTDRERGVDGQRPGAGWSAKPGEEPGAPSGAGLLPFARHRVLTAPGLSRSRWGLPRELFGEVDISYHGSSAWREGYFQSARRGQEFVLETTAPIRRWLAELLH